MNLRDYLIDSSRKDWSEILEDWASTLPKVFDVWMVNRFGDMFLVFDDNSVNFFDISSGEITKIADSKEKFINIINQNDNAANWLLVPLVDACVNAKKNLVENQCYGYKIPPILGGTYDIENIEPIDLKVNYSFQAQIWRQTKGLPDGTRVEIVDNDQ